MIHGGKLGRVARRLPHGMTKFNEFRITWLNASFKGIPSRGEKSRLLEAINAVKRHDAVPTVTGVCH